MKRDQLADVLRSSCQIAGDPQILVTLGTFDEDFLPQRRPPRERSTSRSGMIRTA